MGLLLSVLITCVGVLEVIACYTHFRLGAAYNECKTNIRHVARYYALELRKHELHFETGPNNGASTSSTTLSDLIKNRQPTSSTVNTLSATVNNEGSPNPAANLKVPRNSISGLDSPTVQTLISPEIDITEAVEKIQHLDDFDIWKSRSPSPFPESDSGVETKSPDLPELSDIPESLPCSPGNQLVERDFWNKSPVVDETGYTKTDLEVQNITEKITRQPSPYPDVLFGITEDIEEETKFDEEFLRSLDGVKSSRCDDKRRSFRKKRNSSSTSSRASEISRSLTSLDEIDNIERLDLKKIEPLPEEEEQKTESFSEKCESIASPIPEDRKEAKVTNHEQTKFEAKVNPNLSSQEIPGKTNVSFTEKVKDLEISVQLLVTVKGTSQGDKMEYTTTVNQEPSKTEETGVVKEEITKSTEDKSEFGNVKTSVTYGTSSQEEQQNLKDLQISSQSLIHAERTVQDDVSSSEAEFLKLYESFTELPDSQKDEFLKIIGQPKPEVENEENIEEIDEEVANITKNITPKSILKKIPEQVQNRDLPEIKEEIIKDLNLPEDLSKETSEIIRSMSPFRSDEKVHITEITEITESTESVISIPPETKNQQATDAKQIELSDKTDNSQVLSPTKECDQDSIENKQANEQMKAENKNTQTSASQEKIEHVISTENTNEKCISTVKTTEPQVVRQLTSRKNDKNGQQIDESVAKIASISVEEIKNTTIEQQSPIIVDQITNNNNTNQELLYQNDDICKVTSYVVDQQISNGTVPISSVATETIATVTTVQQQEQIPERNVVEQQLLEVENVPNKIEQQSKPETVVQQMVQQQTTTEKIPVYNQNIAEEITTLTTTKQQESSPDMQVEQIVDQQKTTTKQDIPVQIENITTTKPVVEQNINSEIVIQQQTTTEEIPVQNENVVEEITTVTTTVQQETTPKTVVETNLNSQSVSQQQTTTRENIPVQKENVVEEITTVTTSKQQEFIPEPHVEQIVDQQTTTLQEIPVQNENVSDKSTTITTTVTEPSSVHVQQVPTSQNKIPVTNEKNNVVIEETNVTTINETSTIPQQSKTTVTQETLTSETKSNQPQSTETKIDSTTVTNESSSDSSSTPTTVVENRLRKAAKTSFEEATSVQNQEMMRRKLSNSDVSPKQASQAFWEPVDEDGGPSPNK